MLSAVRSRILSSAARNLLPLTALHHLPARRQGWWTPPGGGGSPPGGGGSPPGGGRLPPGGGGLPPGFSSRWVTPNTYELTVDMGRGSGGVTYDTSVGPRGDLHITATWGDGQVAHLRHSLPPGVDPSTVKTKLGEDGIIKITARLK